VINVTKVTIWMEIPVKVHKIKYFWKFNLTFDYI